MPSYHEGFCLAVIEAVSVGAGSIGARIYGIVDVTEENVTCLLLLPCKDKRLPDEITRLASDEELLKSLGFAVRKRAVKQFT